MTTSEERLIQSQHRLIDCLRIWRMVDDGEIKRPQNLKNATSEAIQAAQVALQEMTANTQA